MRKSKNIIQFSPYLPPHIGGVEKVCKDAHSKWTYGISSILSGDKGQELNVYNENTKNGQILFYPSLDVVDNFPFPLLWTKKYRKNMKIFSQRSFVRKDDFVITHTRFFLSSFLGGLFARKHNLKWIHIEHGSDYVKLSSKWKTSIAYFYDKTLGKWIIRKADLVLGISNASVDFIKNEFGRNDAEVWYRGIDIENTTNKATGKIKIVFVGRLVVLKGVHVLLEAITTSDLNCDVVIIGDGDEMNNLKKQSRDLGLNNRIEFLGCKERDFIVDFLQTHNCILVNPSYQEGMPTTVIEGLMTKSVVVASDVGGTKEISRKKDLVLVESGSVKSLQKGILYAYNNYEELKGTSYKDMKDKFSRNMSLEKLYKIL